MAAAMRGEQPDRVPVMCQPSIGHMLVQTAIAPTDLWFNPKAYVQGLLALRARYSFDGLLVCLTSGCDPTWQERVARIDGDERGQTVFWRDGRSTLYAWDDTPDFYPFIRRGRAHYSTESTGWPRPVQLAAFDPSQIETLDAPQPGIYAALDMALAQAGAEFSIHGEVVSPFDALICILGMQEAYTALLDYPTACHAILEQALRFCSNYAVGLVEHGAHAVKVSSPYVGGGLISRAMYREFVLPYERRLAAAIHRAGDVPVYTHTCGAIGDRLELLAETGVDGLECLDPPPLGNVELADAKRRLRGRLFIKGNVDAVNTLLLANPAQIGDSLRRTIAAGKPGGGFVLSTACTIAPRVPAAHVQLMAEAARQHGRYR